jgi:hypothetical protein
MRLLGSDASDAAFERALLESARDDGPPPGATAAAWAKFASVSGGVASGAGADTTHARRAEGHGWFQSAPAAPLKWLALGALGGGLLTAAWLKGRPGREDVTALATTTDPAAVVSATPVRATLPAPTPRAEAAPEGPAPAEELPPRVGPPARREPRPSRATPTAAAAGTARSVSAGEKPGSERAGATSANSRLSAEVAALDAVRTALAIGAPEQALRGIDAYRREFPQGELTPDAHVLEVEALAAKGDRAATRRESERFLARYPKDPHVTRVRWLAEQ